MKSACYIASLLTAGGSASYVRAPTPLVTLTFPIPSQGTAFTSTIPGCDTVDPFVVVGNPNGTFLPGTQTYYLPPQAEAASSTFVDPKLNATQVIVVNPLPGTCEPFGSLSTATDTAAGSMPTDAPDPGVCPLEGCSQVVNKAAQKIIDALGKVTLISQSLQNAAKQIGLKRDNDLEARDALTDLLRGLRQVPPALTVIIPYVQFSPIIPPGCDSDTVVVALIDFVRVHQALLEILIGRSSLLSSGSGFSFGGKTEISGGLEHSEALARSDVVSSAKSPGVEKFPNPLGIAIAAVLRAIESVVDNIAFGLISIIPTRDECLKQQKFSIDGTLNDAISAYSS
ncbi:hypothetical protein SCUP234_09469 [Seiridium cupressi]